MDSNTKQVMAVFSLMLGLSWGIPYLVSEDRNTSWLMFAIFFLILALVFWLWIQREQQSADDAAGDALDAAEDNLKKLEAQAAAQEAASESAQEAVEAEPEASPEPTPEPEPVAKVAEVEPEPDPVVKEVKAKPVAAASAEPDDLTRVEGIGPKYAEILASAGITTFAQIAAMSEDSIVELIKANGGRRSKSMGTWAEQAKLAAAGDWDAFDKLQDELSGGSR